MNDTIAAVATATGTASVAIVRLSGPDALAIARRMTRREDFRPRYAHLSNLYDGEGRLIDEGIVIWFQAPRSFTTEDVVEFQCHGGYIVAEKILDSLIKFGARPAEPGEFTRRAFLGGRIDLSEAEAIGGLIEAKSEEAARILARQMKGELKEFVEEVRQKLIRAVAFSEVTIDYAEEDLPQDLLAQLTRQLRDLAEQIERIVQGSRRRRGMIEGFKIAIVGKPNAGKSSLLNALLDYDRAIVSSVAGTTRDTIEEQIRIGTHLVRIVDTAGIRDSTDTIEKIGIERSLKAVNESDAVLALFDLSRPKEEEDKRLLEILSAYRDEKAILPLLNKADLPHRLDTAFLEGWEPILLDQKDKGAQVSKLLKEQLDKMAADDEILLVTSRQIAAVERTKEAITQAIEPLLAGELELFSFHLNEAIEAISSISRPVDFNEIMDKMFSEFCLGK